MIDFKNAEYLKLKVVSNETFVPMIAPMFVDGEYAIQAFQTIRDGIVFTNKRIFAINVQGITGKKKILLPFRTVKYRHFLLKLLVFLIWIVNWNFGLVVLVK